MYTQPRPGCATPKLLPEKLIERLVSLRIGASGLIEIGDSLEGMKNQADQYEAEENATSGVRRRTTSSFLNPVT